MNLAPVSVHNKTNGRVVCDQAIVAATFRSRFTGLRGRPGLSPGEGLLIQPTSAVHTLGMKFPIDAIALDRHLRVLGLRSDLKQDRIAVFDWKTHSVLELPAGQIERASICLGDQLLLSSANAVPVKRG